MIKKSRKECFFGVHFDFHAMPGETVGEVYQPDVVAKMLDEVKPDFVQCDTKGHAGLSSYPTKVGNQADKIAHDVLRMWRDLTKERGIRLYAHHSGLFDRAVLQQHPDWGAMSKNGEVSTDFISVFSPYVDEILIPQLLELCEEYEMDGAWVDGECWGAKADYGPYAAGKYLKETGKKPPVGEEDHEEYEEFCRQGFLDYVRHYIEVIKEKHPHFEITSNWIYSAYMPEEPQFELEFLSGDYASANSVESARYNGRCLAARGMTWDLMAWGQNAVPGGWMTRNRTTKEYAQYCQEAAQIIAMGGGFQFFNIMYGYGGTVQEWAIPMWAKVAAFCREREAVCHGAKLYPEVAVVYTNRKGGSANGGLYNQSEYSCFKPLCTWISALSNNQISSEVLYEYQLKKELSKYKVIVLPSSENLEAESRDALVQYVKDGGVLILDSQAAMHFGDVIQADIEYLKEEKRCFLDGGEMLCCVEAPVLQVTNAVKCEIDTTGTMSGESLGISSYYYHSNIYEESKEIAAFQQQLGKGVIQVICVDVGRSYSSNRSGAYNNFLCNQLAAAGYEKTVDVKGSSLVDVILTEKEDSFQINLVNMAGNHNVPGVRSYNEIPMVGPLTVTINCQDDPGEIYLELGHVRAEYKYDNGKAVVVIPRLEIHQVIVVSKGLINKKSYGKIKAQ